MKQRLQLVMLITAFLLIATKAYAACPDNLDAWQFTVSDDVVIDQQTGLMWQKCPVGATGFQCDQGQADKLNWQNALAAASAASLAGFNDWRLPNIKELGSIVNLQCYAPSIAGAFFPNTPADYFWTSSFFSENNDKVWLVSFYYGEGGVNSSFLPFYVRLVRKHN